ncbi:ATPase component of Mn/Zn ABC-type transporter [Rhodobacteraceae bacterium HIMB11]|nr:ATPase component of Mn/Zn ABC-type transporter [Rhodobacteraceae bacterium HIMB11]
MSANAITVNELTVDYDGVTAIEDVYFAVHAEKLTAIVGPNGAGKSTLIKALLGLIPTRTGTISCFGKSPKQYRKDISYVPQRAQIDWEFPANVFDVVAMGLYGELGLLRRFSSAHKDRVRSALTDVDMADFATRQISQLSGGQQQRVFLARSIVQDAKLILLDEPFGGIDAKSEAVIVDILRRQKQNGKSIVAVHHDLSTVKDYFDDVILLNKTVTAFGPVNDVFTKTNVEKTYGVSNLDFLTGRA